MLLLLRVLGRIGFVLLAVALLGVMGWLYYFTLWRDEKVRTLTNGSEIVRTARGEVEFVVEGEGPCVLIFHGTPGGYDQSLLLADGLAEKGFEVVAPSRPGYLRTPLISGLLPQEQADLMAALLDALGIDRAIAIGFNGGASAAVEFATRHPGKAGGLVLVSPVLMSYDYEGKKKLIQPGTEVLTRLTGDVGSWLALQSVKEDPRPFLRDVLRWTSRGDYEIREKVEDAVLADPVQLKWFQDLAGTFAPLSPRETGARNDGISERYLPEFKWDKIKAPTLIVEGREDKSAVLAEIQVIATKIPGAKLRVVDGAGTMVMLGPWWTQLREEVIGFLRECAQTPPAP